MKNHFKDLLLKACNKLQEEGLIPNDHDLSIKIENTRNKSHGDFACNIALTLSKTIGVNPRQLAQKIVDSLPSSKIIVKIEIAGPGFINAFLKPGAQQEVIREILQKQQQYGHSTVGAQHKIHLEFVSANPTGPLHVGHGRGAAYGATLANILTAIGHPVHREYYVNDAGRQMNILAVSVWLRYLDLCGEEITFPSNGYRGDYIWDIAASLHRDHRNQFLQPVAKVIEGVPDDAPNGDKDAHIDGLICNFQKLLTTDEYDIVFAQGLSEITNNIRQDLSEFGVDYDQWFHESRLVKSGEVDRAIDSLRKSDYLYEKEGALWFKSSSLGDEKDRVVVRDNGLKTYLATDIAYHVNKLNRGYDEIINIWGADHHGYIPRVMASMQALGHDSSKLKVLLVQFAVLFRGGEKAQMSTRAGEFVSLRQLRQEVGNDAARFFYVLRKCEQHMDFDLDLAKSQSKDNPVYYIQYAHARVCSVIQKLNEKKLIYSETQGVENLDLLTNTYEHALIMRLTQYPEIILRAAQNREPHQIAYYLRELANEFHTYYNAKDVKKILEEEDKRRNARLCLSLAIKQVISNGLGLMGVSAPQSM